MVQKRLEVLENYASKYMDFDIPRLKPIEAVSLYSNIIWLTIIAALRKFLSLVMTYNDAYWKWTQHAKILKTFLNISDWSPFKMLK